MKRQVALAVLLMASPALSATIDVPIESLDAGVYALTVPEGLTVDDPAAYLEWAPALSVTVDGQPVEPSSRFPYLVPLSPGARRIVVTDSAPFPERHSATFGSARALLTTDFAADRTQAVVGITLSTVGVLLLLTSLTRRRALGLQGLGGFAFGTGMISVGQCIAWSLVIFDSYRFWFYARMTSVYVYPIGFAALVVAVFGDTARAWLKRLSFAMVAWLGVSLLLYWLEMVRFHALRRGAYLLLFGIIGVTIGHLWGRRKNDPVARTFFVGFVVMAGLGLPDMVWGMGLQLFPFHTAPVGLLAFTFAGGLMLAQRSSEQRAAAETALADVRALNVELRQQVERRSRDMKEHFAANENAATGLRSELVTGEQVDGRYTVLGMLGAGAMGAVYTVSRVSDGKRFALKMLTGKVTGVDAARFAREAEIAAKLSHPNLVGIVDVGRLQGGLVYLVMELVDGRTLEKARAEFGNQSFARPLLRQLAEGLAALHGAGFVHRDLKPANVLLARDKHGVETARIADFGVARESAELTVEPKGHEDTLDSGARLKLTQTGAWVGTPMYMAPEMAKGHSSPASDVYALGLIAFEVAVGRYPFDEPPVIALLSGRPVPPIAWRDAALEAPLRAFIERALAHEPAGRPGADELPA